MVIWLDGRTNVKARPQENFARELMELFTMGVGNYAETDVYAGARVFTGWNLQRANGNGATGYYTFFYDSRQHDTTVPDTIQRLALAHRRRHGYRWITVELRELGLIVNHKRVFRITRQNGMLLARHTVRRNGRVHDGKAVVMRSNALVLGRRERPRRLHHRCP